MEREEEGKERPSTALGTSGGEGEDLDGKGLKRSPSTSSGRTGAEAPVRIAAGKSRSIQMVRSGGRKLFRGKLRREFLEWFAATANVKWSADRVGIAYQTVWKHRMKDPSFAEDYERALEQGVARVRAKMIETKAKVEPMEIDGDWDAPELQEIDPQIGLTILREHGHGISGPLPEGRPHKAGRAPRVATNAEVEAALAKRLKAYAARVHAGGASAAQGPLHQASPGPPPRSGED